MKKFILLFGLITLFIACSDDSSSANNEKQNSLQLNEGCEKFVTDSSLWKAIQDSDLASLKKSIENCASLDMKKDIGLAKQKRRGTESTYLS